MSGWFEAQRHVSAGSRSIAARRSAFSTGTIGSRLPELINTRVPARSGTVAGVSGTIARKRIARGEHSRAEQENGGRDVRAIGITDRGQRCSDRICIRSPPANKIGQFVRAPNDVFFIEDAFSQAPEKSRHAVFQDVSAQTQERGGRIQIAAEGDHVIFVSAGSMEEKKHAPRRRFLRGNETGG